jgi:ubiquinone/menaquinone biosynthesis C-methylase UbiE
MTLTSIFRVKHLEPPPWLYAWMARSSLLRMIYRRINADLAAFLPTGARVLDVGTGPGYLLEYLAERRPDLDLWGLDLAPAMIRRARRRQGEPNSRQPLKWVVADALALPFPARTFHLALATFSFHNWPQPVTGLTEMLRVLRPGGQAWIYELQRQIPPAAIKAFAREEKLPFPLVYLGFKASSRHHALPTEAFTHTLKEAGGEGWQLRPVHRLFWRAELSPPAAAMPR